MSRSVSPLRSFLLLAAAALSAPAPQAWAQDQPPSPAPMAVSTPTPVATSSTTIPASTVSTPAARPLDLAPPDIRKIMPAEALTPLAEMSDEDTTNVPDNTVQVKGQKSTPDVPGGILSVFWALWHPTQAWRIVAPVQ